MRLAPAPWIALIAAFALVLGCNQMADKESPSERVDDLTAVDEKSSTSAFGGLSEGRANDAPAAPSMQAARKAEAPGGAPASSVDQQAREADAGDVGKAKQQSGGEKAAHQEKKKDASAGLYIIRRANLTLQVEEVKKGVKQVTDIARAVGGFVAESAYEAAEGAVPSARMVLRIPADKFDAVLDSLGGVGKVFGRHIDSEDVTMEYVDTSSRIKNLRQEESTLLKLLQRTGKLSEVLEMERELSRVRGEIEQSQGRLRHLGALVSLSTIEISLAEKVQIKTTSPWGQLPAAFENALKDVERALADAIEWALRTGVWLIGYFLPLALPLIALYLIGGWALRGWLIERRKFMPETWFVRFWIGLGLALIAMWWPPLTGLIVMAALAAAVIGAVSWVVGRFFVRKRELD